MEVKHVWLKINGNLSAEQLGRTHENSCPVVNQMMSTNKEMIALDQVLSLLVLKSFLLKILGII